MDLVPALQRLYPVCKWELHGVDYDGLIWYDETVSKPERGELVLECEKINNERPLKDLRKQRDTLLAKTDKYANTDWPHASLAKQTEWIEYRQTLRNLPSVTEDPVNPVWPVRPDEVVAVVVKEETSNVVAVPTA